MKHLQLSILKISLEDILHVLIAVSMIKRLEDCIFFCTFLVDTSYVMHNLV
jgi:hypothetical protein